MRAHLFQDPEWTHALLRTVNLHLVGGPVTAIYLGPLIGLLVGGDAHYPRELLVALGLNVMAVTIDHA